MVENLEQIADKVIETDVLMIGGGIGGCCAAAKAKEKGLDVTLIEKAHIERSGSSAQGIDHYEGFFTRDGTTTLENVRNEDWRLGRYGARYPNLNVKYRLYKHQFWVFDELEKLGVPMRWDDGEPYWIPFPFVGWERRKTGLRVHWTNIKPILAKAVKKSGARVLNRTMAVDLLTNNGRVVGASAVDIRTGKFIVIKAKATLIATGKLMRLYNPETPLPWKFKFRYHFCPASSAGDGYALVYRAGGDLVNMDISGWTLRHRDDLTISYGSFSLNDGIPMKCYTWDGTELLNPNATRYRQLEEQGKTPIYFSFDHFSDDLNKRIEVAFADERLLSFKVAQDRGFNPRTHRYELQDMRPTGFYRVSGIYIDENFRVLRGSLPIEGLYAFGDGTVGGTGGVAGAASGGLLLGEDLPAFLNDTDDPVVDISQVESHKQTALAPLSVKEGTEPLELESALRYLCERYVGMFKSEGKLREGLRRLSSLKGWLPKLSAETPHYLIGSLECRNLLEIAEVHIRACIERKETRGNFFKVDFPDPDPEMDNKFFCQRIEDGKAILELGEHVPLKPEYLREAQEEDANRQSRS